ncbi:MAG TPA: CGNR zinc finger domain-containing protein [Thermoleophilaceae bacterium]|nr:CGNR zinc finger domain-containing protein [Thermoleophilaceae bacterium]
MIGESSPEKTAPEPLRLVQRFVNSLHVHENRPPEEELVNADALRDWLVERDLLDPSEAVSEADVARVLDVREGLRAVLAAHNGEPLDGDKMERLNAAAQSAGVRVGFTADAEPRLVPYAAGVDGALARILAIVASAEEQGTWQRLKACPRDCCLWAFYDHSKNRSGRWCSMDSCGNVEKARAFRERRRTVGA